MATKKKADTAESSKGGRPSLYKPEYAEQAKKLCLMGYSDEQIAHFFEVSLVEIAAWAQSHREFFAAITPTAEEIAAFEASRDAVRAQKNARKRNRLAKSPSARIRNAVSARIWAALKGRSDGALFSRLGYAEAELIAHLEAQFQPGMGWDNYGDWHVDHVKPCALFDQADPVQFAECWALANLQPLWASDNITKGAKYAGS